MTGKQEDTGFDPETVFNEGRELGINEAEAALREQIEEMAEAGLQPDEIEQALFSGDTDIYKPRRRGARRGGRGKRKCSAKQWAKMPQICRGSGHGGGRRRTRSRSVRAPAYVYDPAPRGGYRAAAGRYYGSAKRYYKKRGGAKGLVAGLRPLILPGSVLATVYGKYQDRAKALKAAGAKNKDGTPVDGVFQALMYDIQNRPTTSVMDRMKKNASEIFTPALMGVGLKYGAKKVKLHPKVNQVASMGGDALIGVAIGKVISTFLDPPNIPAPTRQPAIQVIQPAGIEVQQLAPTFVDGDPTGGF